MEIPQEYKDLYNHWELHTKRPSVVNDVVLDKDIYKDIITFINKRMVIWEDKYLGKDCSVGEDVLNRYRFCNIYRELDRQTIHYHKILKPYVNDPSLWLLNMFLYRCICNTTTVDKIGVVDFSKGSQDRVFNILNSMDNPKYGNAYIFPISLIQRSDFKSREEFFAFYLPLIIPKVNDLIHNFNNISVLDALDNILPEFGFNFRFHWTEVLIDVGYQYPDLVDLFKPFYIGPGAKPTMERLNSVLDVVEVCQALVGSVPSEFRYLEFNGKSVYLSSENWEGIGCEFRKYSNLSKGEGRRRIYR